MELFEHIIVTEIEPPVTVHSAKGRRFHMQDRWAHALSFCTAGEIVYTMDGRDYVSDPAHAVLLPRGGSYTLRGTADGYFPLINFQAVGLYAKTITVIPLQEPERLLGDYETLKSLFLFSQNHARIFSLFYGMLDRLSRQSESDSRPLLYAMDHLQKHLSDPTLSNETLAKAAGVSEVWLRRMFAARYGTTLRQYILDVRLEKAKRLLADGIYSVTAIAAECGFSSVYHFCRTFRARTGQTPTQYAEQNRNFRL